MAVPAASSEDEVLVQLPEDIEASALTIPQLAAIWNALPGATPIAKFKDRKTGAHACGRPLPSCRSNLTRMRVRPVRVLAQSRRRSLVCSSAPGGQRLP